MKENTVSVADLTSTSTIEDNVKQVWNNNSKVNFTFGNVQYTNFKGGTGDTMTAANKACHDYLESVIEGASIPSLSETQATGIAKLATKNEELLNSWATQECKRIITKDEEANDAKLDKLALKAVCQAMKTPQDVVMAYAKSSKDGKARDKALKLAKSELIKTDKWQAMTEDKAIDLLPPIHAGTGKSTKCKVDGKLLDLGAIKRDWLRWTLFSNAPTSELLAILSGWGEVKAVNQQTFKFREYVIRQLVMNLHGDLMQASDVTEKGIVKGDKTIPWIAYLCGKTAGMTTSTTSETANEVIDELADLFA